MPYLLLEEWLVVRDNLVRVAVIVVEFNEVYWQLHKLLVSQLKDEYFVGVVNCSVRCGYLDRGGVHENIPLIDKLEVEDSYENHYIEGIEEKGVKCVRVDFVCIVH